MLLPSQCGMDGCHCDALRKARAVISSAARRLYRRLLEAGLVDPDDAPVSGLDDPRVAELIELGLINLTDGRLGANPPRAARGSVAIAANRKSRDLLQDAIEVEAFLNACMPAGGESGSDGQSIEIIRDGAELMLLSGTLPRQARREVLAVHTARFPGRYKGRYSQVYPSSAADVRVIYSQELIDTDSGRRLIEACVDKENPRIHPSPPLKFKVIDGRMALLPFDDTAESGGLLIKAPSVCDLLVDYFEKLWNQSVPPDEVVKSGTGSLKPIQLRILALLADDMSDVAMARRLGLSERTLRRHVSDLLGRLGAVTRPGALAIALRRGLIS